MEISNEMMIDVALNAAGFILAGVLTIVVYSMFGRKKKSAASTDLYSAANGKDALASTHGQAGARIEFIDFQSKENTVIKPAITNVNSAGGSSQFEKNRMEVFNQAKAMINGGQRTPDIRRNAALTNSNLNISNQGRNVMANRGAANGQ